MTQGLVRIGKSIQMGSSLSKRAARPLDLVVLVAGDLVGLCTGSCTPVSVVTMRAFSGQFADLFQGRARV